MRFSPLTLAVAVLSIFLSSPAWGQQWSDSPEVAAVFKKAGIDGCFVFYDLQNNRLTGFNQKRAETRYIPASTFKAVNSVIGLSVGAVADVDTPLPYGGQPQSMKEWEKDMGLREAIKVSNVPIYQELARRIGLEKMKEEVKKMGYGNGQIGDKVDRFWLDGPLAISAVEQARLMARLAGMDLPQSRAAQAQTREIMLRDYGSGWSLYAKTGTALARKPGVAWLVGWIEKEGRIYPFAMNLEVTGSDWLIKERMDLTMAGFKALGIIDQAP